MTPDREQVILTVAGQRFAALVADINEVFRPGAVSPVPLAPPEVAGVLNLRGRIVTLICARRRLGLPARADDAPPPMALGMERRGELYGLLVDSADEVRRLPGAAFGPPPPNLPPRWAALSTGVYRLDEGLTVALDMNRVLDLPALPAAA